MDNRNFR